MPDLGRIKGPIVIGNCIEVDVRWTMPNGKVVKNILHGQVAAGFAASAAIAQSVYAALLASASWTAWLPFMHTTANILGISLRDLRAANNPLVDSTGAAVAGTGALLALPPGTALAVTLRTASAGRAFRGRVYLPVSDSGALVAASGQMTAAAQTAGVNLVTAMQTALNGQGITMSIAQPARQAYTGKLLRAIPARAANVVNVTGVLSRSTTLRSQRRRSLRI